MYGQNLANKYFSSKLLAQKPKIQSSNLQHFGPKKKQSTFYKLFRPNLQSSKILPPLPPTGLSSRLSVAIFILKYCNFQHPLKSGQRFFCNLIIMIWQGQTEILDNQGVSLATHAGLCLVRGAFILCSCEIFKSNYFEVLFLLRKLFPRTTTQISFLSILEVEKKKNIKWNGQINGWLHSCGSLGSWWAILVAQLTSRPPCDSIFPPYKSVISQTKI